MNIISIIKIIFILYPVQIMYSTYNTDFLLSLSFLYVENADFIVSNQGKNSIDYFVTVKGGAK